MDLRIVEVWGFVFPGNRNIILSLVKWNQAEHYLYVQKTMLKTVVTDATQAKQLSSLNIEPKAMPQNLAAFCKGWDDNA